MKEQSLQGTGKVVCAPEVVLIDTKEQLEFTQQKVRELQSLLRDKENEINFLKEVLFARADLVMHQNNTIASLQKKLADIKEKPGSPVIVMKAYLPEIAEGPLSETAI